MAPSPRTRVELYFSSRFEGEPRDVVFRPGRVVLLGEHVDHQGGTVLAAPTHEGVYVAWQIRPDHRVRLHALNARASDRFEHGRVTRSGRRWADLARGVCAKLADRGQRLPGVDLAVYGDLPSQAGLASSAAYTCAVLAAFLGASGATLAPADVARLVADVEREWAGVACGFMDPYVAEVGTHGEVVRLDNRTLEHETLALPATATLAHVGTGVTRRLSETPYNERRRELRDAWAALRAAGAARTGLVDLDPAGFEALAGGLPEPLRRRARHVVTECARVREGVEALGAGDAARLGALMNACHASLSRDFECSMPAIDEQVARLQAEAGVLGARLQGAGWGGSLAVLRTADA